MTKEIAFIDDYQSLSENLLISQFKDKQWFKNFLLYVSPSVQEIENTIKDLFLNRNLDNAIGKQLDGLGVILGLQRFGLNDEEYRDALRFQAFLNYSKGEGELLITALRKFTKSVNVSLIELFPATCYGYFDNQNFIMDQSFNQKMDNLCMGGVKWLGSVIGNDRPFIMDELYYLQDDPNLYGGFSIYDEVNGLNMDDGTCGILTFFI
jgi:hypothetical protein